MSERFRYNDLKEDAGVCGGCGLMAGPGLTAMGIESFFVYNLLILHGLVKSDTVNVDSCTDRVDASRLVVESSTRHERMICVSKH